MIILSILILGSITFFYRFAFFSSFGKKWADLIPTRFLQLLAPATFAAIIMNSLLIAQTNTPAFRARLIVGLTSLILAHWTKNILATLVFGLSFLYFLTSVF
jgi:branched-subunit amino acid transport protein